MQFEWDENKRQTNLRKHGLDLLRGADLFDRRLAYVYSSPRFGEGRFVTIARLDAVLVALVWTERGSTTFLISLRRARDAEERAYRALHG
jgi:uncharacterized DUF497 family protein